MVAWSRARKAHAWAAVKGPSVRFLPGRWRLICSRLVKGHRSVTAHHVHAGPFAPRILSWICRVSSGQPYRS
jgi:hypothetical protein